GQCDSCCPGTDTDPVDHAYLWPFHGRGHLGTDLHTYLAGCYVESLLQVFPADSGLSPSGGVLAGHHTRPVPGRRLLVGGSGDGLPPGAVFFETCSYWHVCCSSVGVSHWWLCFRPHFFGL